MATRTYSMKPRCAILPSPEKLNTGSTSPGQDETNTRGDFDKVWRWLRPLNYLNLDFRGIQTVDEGKQLEDGVYKSLIWWAFAAFGPIRNTSDAEGEEMVLLYYAGHGLSVQGAVRLNEAIPNVGQSSSPRLDKVGYCNEHFAAADRFLPQNGTVKGGEFCLHDVGFCDLRGLLKPWIAAVKEKSIHLEAGVTKKNKHLIVIADSCYSGKLVEDLEQLALKLGPWNEHDCTVTVQSASGSGEPTFGGYFTPCFVYLNKPENKPFLQKLKNEWDKKSAIERNAYRAIQDLPSPQVATTMPSEKLSSEEDDPILKLPRIQGAQLNLFRDAGFFKFCFLSLSGIMGSKARALTRKAANRFVSEDEFDIIDFKLKTISNGTPMALVFVIDPNDEAHVVCVHIHFKNENTALENVSGVNLIHHDMPTNVEHVDFISMEDLQDSSPSNPQWNFYSPLSANTTNLVEQCLARVQEMAPQILENFPWNMKQSFNTLRRRTARSEWMDDYVKKVKK